MMSFTEEQKQEIKEIFHEAMTEWITGYGLTVKNVIVGLAAVLVALAVIGKAFAFLLGMFGLTQLK